jgi:exosortase B
MKKQPNSIMRQPLFAHPLMVWLPAIIGLVILYTPTYFALSSIVWSSQDQAHGPIVLLVILYLFWQRRDQFQFDAQAKPSTLLGYMCIVLGLICYSIGRSQDILLLDVGSQIPVIAGLMLLVRGFNMLKAMWFPLFFIIFMIPLPGALLDAVTMPMKLAVSTVAESVLHWFGYHIGRAGVVLQIKQYQLLVADACAGMHTLISLEALGLLYLSLFKHDSVFRNVTLAILIIPISFTANVIRVLVITLVTYYFGDDAGQGFIHGFAGMVLFLVALVLIICVDNVLQYLSDRFFNASRT